MSTAPVGESTQTPDASSAATSDARLTPKEAADIDAAARRPNASSNKGPRPQPTAEKSSRATACRKRAEAESPRTKTARIFANKSGGSPDVAFGGRQTKTPPFAGATRRRAWRATTRDMPEGRRSLNRAHVAPMHCGLPRDGRRRLGPQKQYSRKEGVGNAPRFQRQRARTELGRYLRRNRT